MLRRSPVASTSISDQDEASSEERAPGSQVLATLRAGDCFGERALLKAEVRYAGVVATSPDGLMTMSVTREAFEAALGPLRERLPESKY